MEERTQLLKVIAGDIQTLRRERNNQLLRAVEGDDEVYNLEDLFRLVGELNASYNHCVASLAGDGDIYCLLKHLATAVVLSGEVDGDAEMLYSIVDALTGGKIAPCQSCHVEEE